ncbi:MAG: M23 family metallopeptidase [Nitriliruptorales bacterium]
MRPREHWRQAGLVLATLLTLATPITLRSPADPEPSLPSREGLPLAVTAGGTGLTAAVERAGVSAQEELESPAAPRVLARFGEVELVTLNREVWLVGFHEASYADAMPLSPIGRMVFNDNPTKFAPYSREEGPDYVVLSSRGRPNAATSAVDMVLPVGLPVASVVTGRISLVEPYLLYGRYPDTKVEIIPEVRPDLRVVMIHLRDVRVEAGQRVVGGETVVAGSANHFPFSSQVDRYLGRAAPGPHVHIEVKGPAVGPPLPPSGALVGAPPPS